MAPVESVYFLQDEFNRLKRENLIVKVFADCGHTLDDADGKNHKAEFLRIASDWWNKLFDSMVDEMLLLWNL